MADTEASPYRIAQQFGNAPPRIVGFKFNDVDADGFADPGEAGVPNVTFILNDLATGAELARTTTDANGNFSFINLVPGTYTVTEQVPDGRFPTTPNPVFVTITNTDARVLFGNSTTPGGTIIGCKYLDIDGDGFRDGDEPGIKNVRIYIDENDNGIFDAGELDTLTDENGEWRFFVEPGKYRIREERVNGPTTEPLEADFYQSTPPGNIPVLDVELAAGQVFACAQVGNAPLYQVDVEKFEDANRNGVRDAGERGLERVPFILDFNRDGRWQPAEEPIVATDVNGFARFTDVRAGSYAVLEVFANQLPGGLLPASLGGGNPGNLGFPVATTQNPVEVSVPGSSRVRFQGSISEEIPLLVADPDYALDVEDPKFIDLNGDSVQNPGEESIPVTGVRPIFADLPNSVVTPQPSVIFTSVPASGLPGSGVGNTRPNINIFKFADQDGDGFYEPARGDVPVQGVTVFLDVNGDGVLQAETEPTRVTNVEGRAAFTNLEPGNYTVIEQPQAGFSPSTSPVVQFSLNTQDANVFFGNTPNSRITGCKFEDFNQNGYRDGNEPAIAGTTIFIDLNGDGTLSADEPNTVSDQFGRWEFNNLSPGIYRIREVVPAGFFQTTQFVDVVLGPNQTFTCTLVGNSQRYDLFVPKFRDDNRNGTQDGTQDGGEPPLVDIPFTLDLNRNGRYDPATEPLVRTDANGIATFTDLQPGTYAILEVFDPSVPNPFPIPTGPNPVNYTVPGPNATPVSQRIAATPAPTTTDTLTGATTQTSSVTDSDVLLSGGNSATQLSSGFELLAPDSGAATLETPELAAVSSLTVIPTDPNAKDQDLLLGAPQAAQVF